MNQVINADFTSLELRILAGGFAKGQPAMILPSPTGRYKSNVMADLIFPGVKRDPLVAPGACTINVLKKRPEGGDYHLDVPHMLRLKSGLQ